jgi:8-hydroxy-5-deazaflavin:NADPH oxidoreductase
MSYAIIGFGKIGHALAKAFARKGIEVYVATTRDPESAGHPVSPNKSSHRS